MQKAQIQRAQETYECHGCGKTIEKGSKYYYGQIYTNLEGETHFMPIRFESEECYEENYDKFKNSLKDIRENILQKITQSYLKQISKGKIP